MAKISCENNKVEFNTISKFKYEQQMIRYQYIIYICLTFLCSNKNVCSGFRCSFYYFFSLLLCLTLTATFDLRTFLMKIPNLTATFRMLVMRCLLRLFQHCLLLSIVWSLSIVGTGCIGTTATAWCATEPSNRPISLPPLPSHGQCASWCIVYITVSVGAEPHCFCIYEYIFQFGHSLWFWNFWLLNSRNNRFNMPLWCVLSMCFSYNVSPWKYYFCIYFMARHVMSFHGYSDRYR